MTATTVVNFFELKKYRKAKLYFLVAKYSNELDGIPSKARVGCFRKMYWHFSEDTSSDFFHNFYPLVRSIEIKQEFGSNKVSRNQVGSNKVGSNKVESKKVGSRKVGRKGWE